MSMYMRKVLFCSFLGFLGIQQNICFSYSSLDFEFFSLFLCFFSFFVYDVIVLFWASRFLINKIYYSFLLKKKKKKIAHQNTTAWLMILFLSLKINDFFYSQILFFSLRKMIENCLPAIPRISSKFYCFGRGLFPAPFDRISFYLLSLSLRLCINTKQAV